MPRAPSLVGPQPLSMAVLPASRRCNVGGSRYHACRSSRWMKFGGEQVGVPVCAEALLQRPADAEEPRQMSQGAERQVVETLAVEN